MQWPKVITLGGDKTGESMIAKPSAGPTAVERGRAVRARLLQAAVECIPQHGWEGVSTRIVANQAGVAAGLVHYHFASLQALLREATLGTIRSLIGGLGSSLHDARTAQQVLNSLFAALDGFSGRDPLSMLMAEAYLAANRDDELRAGLVRVIEDFRGEVAQVLAERGVRDSAGTAGVLAAAIDGVVLHRAIGLQLPAATVTRVLGRSLQLDEEGTSP